MQGLVRPALLLKHLSPRISLSDLALQQSSILLCKTCKCSSTSATSTTLDALYPGTSGYKAGPPPQIKPLYFSGYIPVKELSITYSGSAGPGGQNVNKTSTKVDIRFHMESATWLTPEVKSVLL